jgi:hypothetical protein
MSPERKPLTAPWLITAAQIKPALRPSFDAAIIRNDRGDSYCAIKLFRVGILVQQFPRAIHNGISAGTDWHNHGAPTSADGVTLECVPVAKISEERTDDPLDGFWILIENKIGEEHPNQLPWVGRPVPGCFGVQFRQ